MATAIQIQRPYLHPKQREVYECAARFRVLAAGRRWGKTRLGTLACLETALIGGRAWWVAPSYQVSLVGWRLLRTLAQQIPGATVRESVREIQVLEGAVGVRSADSETGLRGEGLDFIVIDEAAHIKGLQDAWEQALRPALSDRQGKALFISTPKGFNHFWELYKQAEISREWAAFQFPTSSNPFIKAEEIEAARLQLPALVFRQEYLAEFVQLQGALFQREWLSNILDELPEAHYVRAWDLAASTKTLADYTAGVKVGLCQDGMLVVADVVRGRWEWPDIVKVIGATAKSDGPAVVQGIEDVGTQKGMLQLLQREPSLTGLAFVPVQVHADKVTRCNPWLARAEQGKLALIRGTWNADYINEVCAFPEADHDDMVDATSAAMQMLSLSGWHGWWTGRTDDEKKVFVDSAGEEHRPEPMPALRHRITVTRQDKGEL